MTALHKNRNKDKLSEEQTDKQKHTQEILLENCHKPLIESVCDWYRSWMADLFRQQIDPVDLLTHASVLASRGVS